MTNLRNFEVKIVGELCLFAALSRFSSLTQDDFLSFSQKLESTSEKLSENNPYLLVAVGNFNANVTRWCSKDNNTTEGISVENVVSQFGASHYFLSYSKRT